VVGYHALVLDKDTIGGRDHRKNCPCVPYWLNSSQPQIKPLPTDESIPMVQAMGIDFYIKNIISKKSKDFLELFSFIYF
jgi:hypothetical protein